MLVGIAKLGGHSI